jgi:hypothetical protein
MRWSSTKIYRRETALEGDWIKEWENKSGRPIQRSVIIEDLKGLRRHHLEGSKVTKFYGLITQMDGRYYPDIKQEDYRHSNASTISDSLGCGQALL